MAGVLSLTERTRGRLRVVAGISGAGALVVFGWLALTKGLPHGPEGDVLGVIAVPAQLVGMSLVAVGLLIAWRWQAMGAATIAIGAVAVGFLSSVEYPPRYAVVVTIVFGIPAFLVWLAWQHDRSLAAMSALAVTTAALLIAEVSVASSVYDKYYGPKHPQSQTATRLESSAVEWFWSGAVSSDSVSVTAKIKKSDATVRLAVAENDSLIDARWSPAVVPTKRVARLDVSPLKPSTSYSYALEVNGVLRRETLGHFRTAPVGPSSFSFAVSACARTGSNGAVFDAIRALDPLLFIEDGDAHYANITSSNEGAFENAYDRLLKAAAQQRLHSAVPTAAIWDDHDYGGNDADGSSKSKGAATAVFDRYVPHTDFMVPGTISQAFDIGRVRFLLTDTRSQRTPATAVDGPQKSMLGAQQRQWLEQELLAGRDRQALTVWVNPDPWIGAAGSTDGWGAYAWERAEISSFIARNSIRNVLMLSGDAHMVAIDDGTNTDYSGTGLAKFPLLHAAALDRPGSVKGGPYSHGTFPGAGQFGWVAVQDDGETVSVTLEGRNWRGDVLTSHRFTVQ